MAASDTLTAESEECRRGSSSSASSVAASTDSYCPPDEWQQAAIKTCVTDDAVAAIAKANPPAPGKEIPPLAERHRAPGACLLVLLAECYTTDSLLAFVRWSESGRGLADRAAREFWLAAEVELMKERFSKLLLGEDMSGSGKGVCTALAISNAITNLCATIFGQLWRLEPLLPEKKAMWRREMDWLLCVSDHIVELVPTWQTFPDGTRLEIMTSRPRSDLYISLPALRKLDHMLLETLESFRDTEFWYLDQGICAPDCDGSASFRRPAHRRDEKWWLPVPRVPPGGLRDATRRQLEHKRDAANQILKAAMAINSNALAEMDVPDSYHDSLPKNGRATLGDIIYRYITSEQFSPDCLLDCLDLSSEYQAVEIANRVEAAVYVWRRRGTAAAKSAGTKSSWGMVKDMIMDTEKRGDLLAERAEGLLISLKQRFPGLTQTSLDMSKIQYNKDVGKSILESYSRVMESLASNIIARIDDLLYVDELSKQADQKLPAGVAEDGKIACKNKKAAATAPSPAYAVPASGTTYVTPSFSPAQLSSPSKIGRALLVDRRAHHGRASKRSALADHGGGPEVKGMLVTSPVFDAPLGTEL
ncbi:hypothetical protein CFC21_002899 [Triticum aestivum]|uniref:PRONE domain-containing protein n=1 Tax=Triticum aestivum TaxID=4565 RepID=A0A3B5Y2U7_WHEAT|nr:hypothetical protein CFC21_002899 [Triticum aestivum]